MPTALDLAKEFLAKSETMSREDRSKAYKALTEEAQELYDKLAKDRFFVPENALTDKRWEVLSPSGRYKLVVTPFQTGKGCWNYTQGVVYRQGSDTPIAEIRRNYGAFPNLFVEDHPKGDWLIGGEDYQGQTVVNLKTGAVVSTLSKGADKGGGFCWADYSYNTEHQLLVVSGCHWACPYEYRFYNFSDPSSGWPEIEIEDGYVDCDEKAPTFESDGTIRTYGTRYEEDEDDDLEDEAKAGDHDKIVDVIKTYRREGNVLKLTNEWVSDHEKDRRVKREEAENAHEAWKRRFRTSDPLYLEYIRLVSSKELRPEEYESIGRTYDTWYQGFDGPRNRDETRWCRRIHARGTGSKGYTIDLSWAVDSGPIKLDVFKDGNTDHTVFFSHSVEDMAKAFAYAIELVRKENKQ